MRDFFKTWVFLNAMSLTMFAGCPVPPKGQKMKKLSAVTIAKNPVVFEGSGPGALPPAVTNRSPLGLISVKSKLGLVFLYPNLYLTYQSPL
mgnify:CR=1 FL=1